MSKDQSSLYTIHKRSDFSSFPKAIEVEFLSKKLQNYVNANKVKTQIADTHLLGASSHQIQSIVKDFVLELGFNSEKKGYLSNMT